MDTFPNKNDIIDEMILAITASITYLQKQGGSFFFLKNGSFQGEIQGNYLYEFQTEFLDDLIDDTEVELRIEHKSSEGKIYSIDSVENKIQLSLGEYLGKDIPEAKLIITSSYLLKILVERLDEAKEGKIVLSELAIKALFPQFAQVGRRDITVKLKKFDEYKMQAASHALGSEISYIWGPPGTGKTTMLSKVIEQLLEEKQSILLLSHTNIATDRVLKSYISNTNYDVRDPGNIGRIIRLGAKPSDEIKNDIEYLGLKQVSEKKVAPLQKEIDALDGKIATINREKADIDTLLSLHMEIQSKSDELGRHNADLRNKESDYLAIASQLGDCELKLSEINQKIANFERANFLGKLMSGNSLEGLVSKKTKMLKDQESLEYKKDKLIDDTKSINMLISAAKSYLSKHEKPNESPSNLERRHSDCDKQIKPLEKEIEVLREKLQEIEKTVIGEAQMIVSTLSNAYVSKPLLSRNYDCVIVDEVSMAPIPALFFSAGLAKKKVVLVGDFCQLPPIAQYGVLENDLRGSDEIEKERQAVKKWLLEDVFKQSGTEQIIRNQEEAPWLKQLKRQYRMHPDIAEVVNEITYSQFGNNYKLESGEGTSEKGIELLNKEPFAGNRLGVVNTELSLTKEFRTKTGSYYNLYSAILTTSLAQLAVQSGYGSVGIITPFRPQANLLQKMIKDKGLDRDGSVTADTVHRFQGEEKDLIIFDLATSYPTKLTDDGNPGGNDEKLINVALSRAKAKCMLICNITQVENKHSQSSAILKFIKWCKEKRFPIYDSKDLLGSEAFSIEDEWLARTQGIGSLKDALKNAHVTDQKNFYEAFCKDILRAEKEIIIDSPFITKNRSEQLLPFLEQAIHKGVRIFILTRTPSDHDENMRSNALEMLRKFEKIGIVVLPFKGLPHRKLAIIDRSILWVGSLNILSQKESQEIMFRTEGATTCEQLLSFLRFDKNVGKLQDSVKLQRCEYCSDPGSWYWTDVGRFGLWTFCLAGGHKKGTPPKTEAELKKKKQEVSSKRKQKKAYSENGRPICPDHQVEMVMKKGRFGEFWGCPEYPKCKITEKIKK